MIKAAGDEFGRRPQQIAGKHSDALLQPVHCSIVASQPCQIGLQFEPDDATFRHARGQAQARRSAAAADIEHDLARFDRDRGGEKNRVDRDARAIMRLTNADAPPEQRIPARRRRRFGNTQRSSPSAAAMMLRARR
jgi:hypothetical protein